MSQDGGSEPDASRKARQAADDMFKEAQRESEDRFALVFEESPVGMALVGLDYRFQQTNRAFTEMLGYEGDELVGWRVDEVTHPDDRELSMEVAERVISGESPDPRVEKRYVTKDGQTVWAEVAGTLIRDAAGEPLCGVAVVQDTSGRRKVEQDLLAHQTRLRSMAADLAATEDRERREIASGLHDDVGQLLTMTAMHLGKLRQSSSPGQAEALAQVISLVDAALQATRSLTFELSPPVLHQMGLAAAVEWLADQLRTQDGLVVHVDRTGMDQPLRDDWQTLLFRIIRELLHNVVKHARATYAYVRLRAQPWGIRITVYDDGVGFDATGVGPGADAPEGFGLFSVQERMMAIGGTLQIDSAPDRGTTVRLYMPLTYEGVLPVKHDE